MMRRRIKLTERDLHKMVRRALMESTLVDKANDEFENIREEYAGNENELIDRLWNYIDDKPGFIDYMRTSMSYGIDDEDYD